MHEIYYTSAPEGLKAGQHGFCTVATSQHIPKPLWDRLEAISGYRHPFDAGSGRNPIAWAHWLVSVGGRETSVLSRICDAGLDYTQRTNSIAHHLALDADERAPAGPAWMLSQGGVMVRQWDGVVGNVARSAPLPFGDVRPAICSAWKRLTGDAGWGGVLAETASKNARRPVCILVDAGQEPLPLIAEAIALLPQRLRWQVTFNTYFTSLPASAQCAWRCCLAGTPAAAETMRHAGGWLVLDLANPSRLGEPPAGPWVELARTGKGGLGIEPASANVTRIRGAAKSRRPEPISLAEPQAEDGPVELETIPPPFPEMQPEQAPGGWALGFRRATGRSTPPKAPAESIVATGEVNRSVDTSWSDMRRRVRRRWLIGMSGLALLFVAAGTWLQVSAYRQSSSRPLSSPTPSTQPNPLADLPPPPTEPAPAPRAPTTQEVAVAPIEPVVVATAPIARETPTTAVAQPPVRPPPQPIELSSSLEPPSAAGAGIRDRTQSILVPVAAFDDLRGIASLHLLLSRDQPAYTAKMGELSGTLSAAADSRARLRQIVTWRDQKSLAGASEVALLQLDPRTPKIEITWRTTMILRRPDVVALARAVLQQSSIIVADERRLRPQRITFKPAQPALVDIQQPHCVPTAGPDWLPGIAMRTAHGLSDGWRMSWGWEWEQADTKRSTETATTVLRFDRGGGAPAADQFDVRIAAGWKSATSTLIAQQQVARTGMETADVEVRRIDEELSAARQNMRTGMEPLEKELAEARTERNLPLADLQQKGTTREAATQRFARAKANIADAKKRWDEQLAGIMTRRNDADRTRQSWKAVADAFDRVKEVDVSVELPDGLNVGTIRLMRGKQ